MTKSTLNGLISTAIYLVAGVLTFVWFDWRLFALFMLWGMGYLSQVWMKIAGEL